MSQQVEAVLDAFESSIEGKFLTRHIFGPKALDIIKAQGLVYQSDGENWVLTQPNAMQLLANYVEKRIRVGQIVYDQSPEYVTEVAAGIALPSLTCQKLGLGNILAIDSNPMRIQQSDYVAKMLGLKPVNQEIKFKNWEEKYSSPSTNAWIVADQPKYVDGDLKLEEDIVKFTIEQGVSLVMVPPEHITPGLPSQLERIESYKAILMGYEFLEHDLISSQEVLIARL